MLRISIAGFFVTMCAGLIGCSSMGPEQLQARGQSKSFDSPLPPDATYRRIVEGTRRCYARRDIGADFFTDTQTGRVSMSVKTSLSIHSLYAADVLPLGNGSHVRVSYIDVVFADAIQQWVAGNREPCPFGG